MTDTSPEPGPDLPLLGRLNRRGFRLVMLLDAMAVLGLAVGSMIWREGAPPWPTYPLGAYALSFSVSTVIFITVFYFGGLYEREPRLGGSRAVQRQLGLVGFLGRFLLGHWSGKVRVGEEAE